MHRRVLPLLMLLSACLSTRLPAQTEGSLLEETALFRTFLALELHWICLQDTTKAVASCKKIPEEIRAWVQTPWIAPEKAPTAGQLRTALNSVGWEPPSPGRSRRADDYTLHAIAMSATASNFPSLATLAVGLTEFLVDRARAEIVLTVYEELRSLARKDSVIGSLFPGAIHTIEQADAEGYRTLIPALRSAALLDIQQLPLRATDPKLPIWNDSRKARIHLVHSLVERYHEIERGMNPYVSIARLAHIEPIASDSASIAAANWLRLIGGIVREYHLATFTDTIASKGSPHLAHLRSYLLHRRARTYFFSFLLSDIELRHGCSPVIHATLASGDGKASGSPHDQKTGDALLDLLLNLDRLYTLYRGSQADVPMYGMTPPAPPDRREYLYHFTQTLISAIRLLPHEDAKPAADFLRDAGEIWSASLAGDYTRAAVITFERLRSLASEPVGTKGSASTAALDKAYRFAIFGAGLAMAKDTDEVEAALVAFADPVGSFRARREKKKRREGPSFDVSLVSYFGGAVGLERATRDRGDRPFRNMHLGAFLPVGIELSQGRGNYSLGLFLSPLDLGTVLSYRKPGTILLETDEEVEIESEPEIDKSNLFVPAAYVVVGLSKKYPISTGLGAQYAPALRRLGDGSTTGAFRVSAFIGVDLTLFRF